ISIEEMGRAGEWKAPADRIEEAIDKLSVILGVEQQITRRDIEMHLGRRRPLPLLAWKDIGQEAIARWEESGENIRGVDVHVYSVRLYPQGNLAAHVIGYVGSADPKSFSNDGKDFHYHLPEMTGARGIEKIMNGPLTGCAGEEHVRITVEGYRYPYDRCGEQTPSAGMDVVLALDSRLQKTAEDVMEGTTGAVVILDPRNGDVLALASSPTFDPNTVRENWQVLISDEKKPLINRAVSGLYPPGSTFKPMVAIAALESGRAEGNTSFNCPGYFELGKTRFHCWNHLGHGWINMRKAIEQSCNSYFCQLGLKCGYERIYHMAEAVGFGQKTGIDLDYEMKGLIPDNAWKIRYQNDQWRSGDTCNVSIGQGALLVTPLHMAVFTAAIANKGFVYRPRLVLADRYYDEVEDIKARGLPDPMAAAKGDLVNDLRWSTETMHIVRGGMYDVVHAKRGTGRRAKVEGVEIGGKTGTAEYGPRDQKKKYAWMIAFAPYVEPRYAMAIVIEDATAGGVDVAPKIAELIKSAMKIEGLDKAKTVVASN
ncbi:MAG: penicillin-binding protein 2, partial [Lentisphaerae bacterium]|nr:penicillin-binding protein 2 [Lentisphaerota bacterium]